MFMFMFIVGYDPGRVLQGWDDTLIDQNDAGSFVFMQRAANDHVT